MDRRPRNPTLLIGLGAFGRAVLDSVCAQSPGAPGAPGDAGRVPNLEVCRVDCASDAEKDPAGLVRRVFDEAAQSCRRLLDLPCYLETTESTDSRGPRLDVFVIGDLSEGATALVVPKLIANLASGLRREFAPILRAGDGALAVCPLLRLPRQMDRPQAAFAIRSLATLASAAMVADRPQARVYLAEDQSGKYLLSRREMERSFAAFLHLLLFSRLRDQLGRDLVEGMGREKRAAFATFACATLEVDMRALQRLCAVKLTRAMLSEFRHGKGPTIDEIAAEANPLVPDQTALEEHLWTEGAGTLESHLKPPRIVVPDIVDSDSPEAIIRDKFGARFQAHVQSTIERFRDDVERFKMDRLALEIERNGTEMLRDLESEAATRVGEHIASGPRGGAHALEIIRYAITDASGRAAQAKRQIDAPDLPDFPKAPTSVAGIIEAANARPRRKPFRMRALGLAMGAVATVLVAGLVNAAFAMFGMTDWTPWVGWPLAALLVGVPFYYSLWAHIKRHRNWIESERSDLDQRLRRYLNVDVVSYFRRRLEYTRSLWVYRVYQQVEARLQAYQVQLVAVDEALDAADRTLGLDEREQEAALQREAADGGILFRSLLTPELVLDTYKQRCPGPYDGLARKYFDGLVASDAPLLEAPFADPKRAFEHCLNTLRDLATRSPFAAVGDEGGAVAAEFARGVEAGTVKFFRELALKLSAPLDLVESVVMSADSHERRFVLLSSEAEPLVSRIVAEHDLGRWTLHPTSHDRYRVHLVLEQSELSPEAIALISGTTASTGKGVGVTPSKTEAE